MRPRLRGSLGVPTGDCQPQGTARPKAQAPSLGEAACAAGPRSPRCVTVCANVSVSDRMPSPVPCPSPVFRLCRSLCVSPSLSLPACVCLPAPVCLPASAPAPRRLGSPSLTLHLFLSLSLLTPGLPSLPLTPASRGWVLWLRSSRPPAISLGVGACECLCVCPCGCMSLVCSLRKVLCLEGGVGARGTPGGRRGGAEELWSTAFGAPVGFGHLAGAGQDGPSGPGLGGA